MNTDQDTFGRWFTALASLATAAAQAIHEGRTEEIERRCDGRVIVYRIVSREEVSRDVYDDVMRYGTSSLD